MSAISHLNVTLMPTPNCQTTIATLLAILLGIAAGCSRPEGVFVIPEHKDLGVIDSGDEDTVAQFQVVNGLSRPIRIRDIYPSCQCTGVTLTKNPIPAGETAILEAKSNFKQQAGRQDMSVTLRTDCDDFPVKTLSYTVMVKARGIRHRQFSLGTFHAGSPIELDLPLAAFARGTVALKEGGEGTRLRGAIDEGRNVLIVKGTAPEKVGFFSDELAFHEKIEDEAGRSESVVSLNLTGTVVSRWAVQKEYYLGFVNFSHDDSLPAIEIERVVAATGSKSEVRDVSAQFTEAWLAAKECRVTDKGIRLILHAPRPEEAKKGAVSSKMELKISYTDGRIERQASVVFAHVSQ